MDTIAIPEVTISTLERLSQKFSILTNECWEWNGSKTQKVGGYSQTSINGSKLLVHRVMYTAFFGAINKELQLDHLCRNRLCINPFHLEQVTPKENTQRGTVAETLIKLNKKRAAERTHCKNGHLINDINVRIYSIKKNGKLYTNLKRCIPCKNVTSNKYKLKVKARTV